MSDRIFLYKYENVKRFDFGGKLTLRQKTEREEMLIEKKIQELSQKALELYIKKERYLAANIPDNDSIAEICKDTKNILYGTESNLPVGFFCSDPVYDLVVGKTKRGKLTKRKPLSGYFYTYYFDGNRLVKAQTSDSSYYLFFYDDTQNTIYEFNFIGNELYSITECKYDERNRICERTVLQPSVANDMFFKFYTGTGKPSVIRDENKGRDFIFEISRRKFTYDCDRLTCAEYCDHVSCLASVEFGCYEFSFNGEYYSGYSYTDCIRETASLFKPLKKRQYYEFLSPPVYSELV